MSEVVRKMIISTNLDNDDLNLINIQKSCDILYKNFPDKIVQDRKITIKIPYDRKEELNEIFYNVYVDIIGCLNVEALNKDLKHETPSNTFFNRIFLPGCGVFKVEYIFDKHIEIVADDLSTIL